VTIWRLQIQWWPDRHWGPHIVPAFTYRWVPGQGPCRWRRSIHMPKWACRLWLEVVSVRKERLQEIAGPREVEAEGIRCGERDKFSEVWDRINPRQPWATNPEVYRIEFRRTRR